MEKKYTPAPWRIGDFEANGKYYCKAIYGSDVPEGEIGAAVCLLSASTDDANAHLISAAPEMLEALQMVADHIGGEWDDPVWTPDQIGQINEAIAKALNTPI